MRDDVRCGRKNEVNSSELIGKILSFLNKKFYMSIKTIRIRFGVDVATLHRITKDLNIRKFCTKLFPGCSVRSTRGTNYSTKIDIKTVPHRAHNPDLSPCRFFFLFSPKLKQNLKGSHTEDEGECDKILWHFHFGGHLPRGLHSMDEAL